MTAGACSDAAVELESDGAVDLCGFEAPQPVGPTSEGQEVMAITPIWQDGCGAYQARVEAQPPATELVGYLRVCNRCEEPAEIAWLVGASEEGPETREYTGQYNVLHVGIQMAVVDIDGEVVYQLCDYTTDLMCESVLNFSPFNQTWIEIIPAGAAREIEYSKLAPLGISRERPFHDYRREWAEHVGEDPSAVPAVDYPNLTAVRFQYPRLGVAGERHVHNPMAACQGAGYPTATCVEWSGEEFPSEDFPVEEIIPAHILTHWITEYAQ